MNPGKLDRRILIQVRVVTRDDTGSRVETWSDLVTVWAAKVRTAQTESTIAGGERPRQVTTWEIRNRAITSANHRVRYNSETYEISGITETGGRSNRMLLETHALGGLS